MTSERSEAAGDLAFDCAGLADVVLLHEEGLGRVGLFSDHGSWIGVTSRTGRDLELVDLSREELTFCELALPLASIRSFPDRLELLLTDGRRAWLGFAGPDMLLLCGKQGEPPSLQAPWSVRVVLAASEGEFAWRILIGPAAETAVDPPADIFELNRARWDGYLARAWSRMTSAKTDRNRKLLARAVTTLFWNLRCATAHLPHAGIIPSPFAYRGYWAWDSWKHAHALAAIAPETAAEQLRAQFYRQRDDGMVPDAVYPDASRDFWSCSKPPLAAWALERVVLETSDRELCVELLPRCIAQIKWFERERRLAGETLFRAGGIDWQTASWDTGWDDSVRFSDVALVTQRDWRLFDLWQPDYNSYCYNEYRAIARLCSLVDRDPAPWLRRADELGAAIRSQLFDDQRSAFCDVRPSTGESTGILSAAAWLPVWAGIADPKQATGVRALLRSPEHFATPLPMPVLSIADPVFDPDGHWNGSVWADHAALALATLAGESDELQQRFLDGLADTNSLHECYRAIDGQPCQGARPAAPQFSWTAAAVLELLEGGQNGVGVETTGRSSTRK